MVWVTDDHVIDDFDLENAPGFLELLRDTKISIRGTRIAAWMVVREHHTPDCSNHCGSEHFARMRDSLIQASDVDEWMTAYPPIWVHRP